MHINPFHPDVVQLGISTSKPPRINFKIHQQPGHCFLSSKDCNCTLCPRHLPSIRLSTYTLAASLSISLDDFHQTQSSLQCAKPETVGYHRFRIRTASSWVRSSSEASNDKREADFQWHMTCWLGTRRRNN
jgi:hypothetical protein